MRFTPTLPHGWGSVQLTSLRYRQMTLDLRIDGEGQRIASFVLDGKAAPSAFVPAHLTGKHEVTIRLRPA